MYSIDDAEATPRRRVSDADEMSSDHSPFELRPHSRGEFIVIGSRVLVAPSRCPQAQAVVVGGPVGGPRSPNRRQRRRKRLYGTVSAPILALVAGALLAYPRAEAHDISMDGNLSNDWIEGLTNRAGKSCCGNNDCRPVVAGSLMSAQGGSLEVEIDGTRFPVPEGSIVPVTSPDGRAWVCPDFLPALGGFRYTIKGVRCLLLPPSG